MSQRQVFRCLQQGCRISNILPVRGISQSPMQGSSPELLGLHLSNVEEYMWILLQSLPLADLKAIEMGALSGITWLLLAQSASAELLSGEVLAEICGAQDLTLSPANPCFFRLFSMAQVWDECETHKDTKSCLASCFSASYCEGLCEHSPSAKCEAQCHKLVACMEDVNGAAATRSCFGGSMPSSSEDERSPLEDWLSLAGVDAEAQAAPSPAVAPSPASVSRHQVPIPAPSPAAALHRMTDPAIPAPSPEQAIAPSPFSAEVALRPSRTASTTTLPVSAAPVTVPEHRAVAPAAEAAEAGGCLCSLTGKLRGTSTGRLGCAAHGQEPEVHKETRYCFVDGPCKDRDFQAAKSSEFPGLYFRECSAVDNLLALFPQSCRAGKLQQAELHSTKTALSRLRSFANATLTEGISASQPLMDAKRLIQALDALKGSEKESKLKTLQEEANVLGDKALKCVGRCDGTVPCGLGGEQERYRTSREEELIGNWTKLELGLLAGATNRRPRPLPLLVPGGMAWPIGFGSFSEVHLARHRRTRVLRAVKRKKKADGRCMVADTDEVQKHPSREPSRRRRDEAQEVEVLLRLDHPNVAKLYEVFECQDDLYLVMELLQGAGASRSCCSPTIAVQGPRRCSPGQRGRIPRSHRRLSKGKRRKQF
eukprot:s755_g30.t5